MRRNVLTVGLVTCAMAASWPNSLYGDVPATPGPTLRLAERQGAERTTGAYDWFWDGMRGPMTLPPGPIRIDLRPAKASGAGDVL